VANAAGRGGGAEDTPGGNVPFKVRERAANLVCNRTTIAEITAIAREVSRKPRRNP